MGDKKRAPHIGQRPGERRPGERRLGERQKKIGNAVLFLAVMALTFYAVLHGQDPKQIWQALRQLSPGYLLGGALLGIFFVSAEGCMIWYLLRSVGGKSGFLSCISYSFIGFFYSGITPSATGGQPMQLYYMNKDGNSLSASSVVLMTVALIYKLVLVIIGLGELVFWHRPLAGYLGGYFGLYLLGLALNTLLVVILLCVMAAPMKMKGLICRLEAFLVRHRILKPSGDRQEKIGHFIASYRDAVGFLWKHPGKVALVVLFTFVQRFSVFLLAYVVYRGFSLEGTNMLTVMLLQASVYIGVDMLPLPGSQGVTELMYQGVFARVFPAAFLMPALYVTRGLSFYFLLLVSLVVAAARWLRDQKRRGEYSGHRGQ